MFSSHFSTSAEDSVMTDEIPTVVSTDSPPPQQKEAAKRKESPSSSEDDKTEEGKKRKRQFKWTEKNKASFEKCQEIRALKKSVEQKRKALGYLLVELMDTDESYYLKTNMDALTHTELIEEFAKYKEAKEKLASYLEANPTKKRKVEVTDVEASTFLE